MKRSPLTLAIGLLLIVIFGLLLFTFQVRQSEVVVVTTFGKPTRTITKPGLYGRLPWGIQMIHRFDNRVQNFEDKFTEGLTQNGYNLLTAVYVGWKITDPMSFFPKFAGSTEPIAEAERVLQGLLSNAKSAVVGKHPLSDFVSADAAANKFAAIEDEILASLQGQVSANNYGLKIEFLGIKKLGLPESVTQSVLEQMTSERKVLADKLQSEGETEAQNIRSDAERRAAELLANAEGQATQIRGEGEAAAAKFLSVFQQNPQLANFIFRLNALEGSLKERTTLIFDGRTPPFDLFNGSGMATNLTPRIPVKSQ
jgi:modulator of FtsH protease HflC